MPEVAMSGRPSSCSVRRGSNPSQTNHIQFLLDASPLLSAYVDAQERHCCCNHAYAACFGLTLEEVVGRSVQEVVGAEAYRSLEGGIRETLAGQRQEWEAVVPSPQIGA